MIQKFSHDAKTLYGFSASSHRATENANKTLTTTILFEGVLLIGIFSNQRKYVDDIAPWTLNPRTPGT